MRIVGMLSRNIRCYYFHLATHFYYLLIKRVLDFSIIGFYNSYFSTLSKEENFFHFSQANEDQLTTYLFIKV